MNREELIKGYAAKYGVTKKSTAEMFNCVIEYIAELLKNGEEVYLTGLCKFGTYLKKSKKARNFQTGELIELPPRVVPYCRFSEMLKDDLKDSLTVGGIIYDELPKELPYDDEDYKEE